MSNSNLLKVGFVGLGSMGLGMSRNLHKAGLLTAVWNRTAAKSAMVAEETGCVKASTPADLAALCEVIIICVSEDEDVLQMISELTPGLKSGAVVVDCSTVGIATAQTAAAKFANLGVGFVDAPVSGGSEGADNGNLAVMAGGDVAHLDKAMPALEAMSARVVHIGEVGNGQATKAVNQIIGAGVAQAVTDGLAFAEAMNLPMEKVIDVVGSGASASWFLSYRGPSMVQGEFPVGFKVALHHKDLKICQRMAAQLGTSLLSIEATLTDYEALMADGFGDEDYSAMYRLKKRKFTPRD